MPGKAVKGQADALSNHLRLVLTCHWFQIYTHLAQIRRAAIDRAQSVSGFTIGSMTRKIPLSP